MKVTSQRASSGVAEVKRRETAIVVASTNTMNGIMSFTVSMTIRRRTRVLLKRENIWKAFALWKKLRSVKSTVLALVSEEAGLVPAIATPKYVKANMKRRMSK